MSAVDDERSAPQTGTVADLYEFVRTRMSMSAVYQPVVIRALVRQVGGWTPSSSQSG